ncbi:hypothetical protein A2533_04170 [Candidatus Falkowbacteria bacterium RIFOXYD2_FULL_35_9]|uniref:Uncharacterized protein n=1 Tax=Candidatus Falkowbacteria bacterium RIFOXYC2_FULL_36_12 TaxID=1798002 RepID=A0A1F5T0L4_9BACT|nr:MAG: hypothetical protein A2300_00545 [Candidatus Falkowbacteria bacterium RIFOXYB2_FULL_35_7]OGF32505.1 MAG: hypothetical protein A2478_02625 [Candidatus Falkowbacteria bacterium RIFOXYC2_FULL_36_12]OGF34575.1 MAG: hypothetical protein A2223_04240 [Candidatus Falkowbacteria bacterium RIFOXYA2_FULL_35_8]OGF48538.1 MAG: hypothetical protein A2533_04170 [Candidatus Falkowbacteria bacterium RIFOXYD2_FULL_35_9]
MKCIVCGVEIVLTDNSQGPICDLCRDGNEFAADRARLIAAAGELTPEEEAMQAEEDETVGGLLW